MGVLDASTSSPNAVTETSVFQLSQPGTVADPLAEVLRHGARALLAKAVEAEVAALLASHADKLTEDGRQRLVRQGHLPEREIMTGIGPIAVRCPRVRDRVGEDVERIRFSSATAALRTPIEEPRGADSDRLPQGHLHRGVKRVMQGKWLSSDCGTLKGPGDQHHGPTQSHICTLWPLASRRHSLPGPVGDPWGRAVVARPVAGTRPFV